MYANAQLQIGIARLWDLYINLKRPSHTAMILIRKLYFPIHRQTIFQDNISDC